ncbi:MAG: GGDEF domain-containing phosphodiesterase, partial [Actinoplanes sp.]
DNGVRLLADVAGRLRTLGHFLAHLGDAEFALVIAGTTGPDDLVKMADRAGRLLAARVAVTAGIVERAAGGTGPDGWLHDARLALRWARQDNRDRAVFDATRAAADRRRHGLAAAMPAALERGEFQLHYQPLHRLTDGALIGVEALARWHRPGAPAPLGPADFITPAERTGLIRPLGRQLLASACRQGAAWRLAGHDLLISVNLSPVQLGEPTLVADVADILHRTGLPAGRLQLEVTETNALVPHRATLAGLAGLGIRLALDDFGTGWSSLAALSGLPFTDVKLAGEFLTPPASETPPAETPPATRTSPAADVLRHVIALGQSLGLTVTAEGIETADQQRLLRDLGCDQGQGYYFARPEPPADITRRLTGAVIDAPPRSDRPTCGSGAG